MKWGGQGGQGGDKQLTAFCFQLTRLDFSLPIDLT